MDLDVAQSLREPRTQRRPRITGSQLAPQPLYAVPFSAAPVKQLVLCSLGARLARCEAARVIGRKYCASR